MFAIWMCDPQDAQRIMPKRILSVGFQIPGGYGEYLSYKSDRSLLDADLIVFRPDVSHFFSTESYQGLRCFSEDTSFQMRRSSEHWRAELLAALKEGKTIVVFLIQYEKFFLDSGRKQYSGTGRNQKVTRMVDESHNYTFLPISMGAIVAARGDVIKKVQDIGFLAPYWNEFGSDSHYELYFNGEVSKPLLTAGGNDRIVGALIRIKDCPGNLVLLPSLKRTDEEFTTYDEKRKESVWSREGRTFGKRLAAALLDLDSQLRKEAGATPEPKWAQGTDYRLSTEETELQQIAVYDVEIQALQEKRAEAESHLRRETSFRALLYENGPRLECAIRDALSFIGFHAENYKDDTSEFDVVFSSDEGRLLGEAEGRDNKAINIDKFSQLERNLHEDFARESISEMAKGVLFGNAFRLLPIAERQEFFTDKCLSAAKRVGAALVRTPDLFTVVQTLKDRWSDDYAQECRRAILMAQGTIVIFPRRKSHSGKRNRAQPQEKIA
jgi:hypothetical protein